MYAYTRRPALRGMGYSDIQGYPSCRDLPGGGVQRCFVQADADIQAARHNGCVEILRGTTTCQTVAGGELGGRAGRRWCCPPQAMVHPSQSAPYRLICQYDREARSAMRNAGEQAVWDVQNRLCALGIDPGPVDGRTTSSWFAPAIRAFQYREGLPETGELTPATLRQLGFSDAANMATAAQGERLTPYEYGERIFSQGAFSWGPIIGVSIASLALAAGLYVYITRK